MKPFSGLSAPTARRYRSDSVTAETRIRGSERARRRSSAASSASGRRSTSVPPYGVMGIRSVLGLEVGTGRGDDPARLQQVDHLFHALAHGEAAALDHQLGGGGGLVGRGDAGELGDLAAARPGVQALGIARLAG